MAAANFPWGRQDPVPVAPNLWPSSLAADDKSFKIQRFPAGAALGIDWVERVE